MRRYETNSLPNLDQTEAQIQHFLAATLINQADFCRFSPTLIELAPFSCTESPAYHLEILLTITRTVVRPHIMDDFKWPEELADFFQPPPEDPCVDQLCQLIALFLIKQTQLRPTYLEAHLDALEEEEDNQTEIASYLARFTLVPHHPMEFTPRSPVTSFDVKGA